MHDDHDQAPGWEALFGEFRALMHQASSADDAWRAQVVACIERMAAAHPRAWGEQGITYAEGFERAWEQPLIHLEHDDQVARWRQLAPFALIPAYPMTQLNDLMRGELEFDTSGLDDTFHIHGVRFDITLYHDEYHEYFYPPDDPIFDEPALEVDTLTLKGGLGMKVALTRAAPNGRHFSWRDLVACIEEAELEFSRHFPPTMNSRRVDFPVYDHMSLARDGTWTVMWGY